MRRHFKTPLAFVLSALTVLTGCHPTQPFYLHEDGDLSHYLDKATEIEHPDVETPKLAEVDQAHAPLTVSNPEFKEIWDLPLEECVHISLQNSKVIRNAASIQANFGFSDALIGRTGSLPTVYDSAITESRATPTQPNFQLSAPGGGFSGVGSNFNPPGTRQAWRAEQVSGTEAALADFDAQFFSGYRVDTQDRPSNQQFGTLIPGVSRGNFEAYEASIVKQTATGAQFRASSLAGSNFSNGGARIVPSSWTMATEAAVTYPLLRGRGEQINRIHVTLARTNTDISLADFESAVRNLLMDIENAYWDLYYSYRNLEAAKIGRDSAQATWKNVYEKKKFGALADQDEAQARGQYFQFRGQVENALKEVYSNEARLRWLMGLAATDGRLIRPKDEPTTARVEFDWTGVHTESLYRSIELRQQKWRIKQRELELISARNWLLPYLTVGGVYRWVGVGDQLIGSDRPGQQFSGLGSNAFDEMTDGKYTEGTVRVDFIPPAFGARRELAAVRNAELGLARAKAHLEEMELNQSHLISSTVRDLDANYTLAQTHFNWWAAANTEVEAFEALYEGGKTTLDLVLEAQRKRAQAQVAYYRSLTDYNKSLAQVHYRKGSLLEHNGVMLSEGPWPAKAYWDALEKARERDASHYLNYGWTRPRVISQGPVEQYTGTSEAQVPTPKVEEAPSFGMPEGEQPETAPEAPEAPMAPEMPAAPEAPEAPAGPITRSSRPLPIQPISGEQRSSRRVNTLRNE